MDDSNLLATLLAATTLALHIVPWSRWLSLARGVSVAYVFIRILPELSAGQEQIQSAQRAAYDAVSGKQW